MSESWPAPLETLTIRGRSDFRRSGSIACVRRQVPNTFVSMVRCASSRGASQKLVASFPITPALLTSTSRWPWSASARSRKSSPLSGSVTSSCAGRADNRPPSDSSSAARLAFSRSRAVTTTTWPSSASCRAISRPMPRAEPLTSATRCSGAIVGRLRARDRCREPTMNFVEDVLERFPASRPALVTISRDGERRVWAFGELIARSAGLSGAFAARGVGRGGVVMTLVGNRVEWVLAMLACWRMGAIALPCNTQLRRADLELRSRAARPALCVGEEELLAELPDGTEVMTMADVARAMDEELPQDPPADALDLDLDEGALIVFTSGTTGEPRAALHPQRYLPGQRAQAEHWLGAREGELAWCTTATGWSKSARNVFVAPWLCGATALLHEGRFDPAERLELIEREGVNVLCQAPTEYRMLAKRADLHPVGALRRMVSAGEPLNPEVIDAFRDALGTEISDGYGQTETGQVTGN